jgi:hypothetical protein
VYTLKQISMGKNALFGAGCIHIDSPDNLISMMNQNVLFVI